jgi:gamma-glutamyltranspeptidase/glutathione hydrolase
MGPGDPYPFQGGVNPYTDLLRAWPPADAAPDATDKTPRPFTPSGVAPPTARLDSAPPTARLDSAPPTARFDDAHEAFYRGTTSVVAADKEGWLVAVTPSGGWIPAVIAGKTGIGLSQRLQSFVLDPRENPFNVLEPGKRPRATLTPSLALRDGKPWLAFAVQGGDGQDQNLLQFLLNRVDFGMTPQQAAEAANMNSFQLRDSFGDHSSKPGRMLLDDEVPRWVRSELVSRGYRLEFQPRTSGPITAIEVDLDNGALWGGVSDHGEDHGIAW